MNSSTVYILLATYNGEAYIRKMIDSVLKQDHKDMHIVLSDDGSTDGTPSILDSYAQAHPQLITHYRSGVRFGNAQDHFLHLLRAFQDARYIMFCDQDDVWHPDKVGKTLQKMQETETDPQVPALVHTDLQVVDRDLNVISPSFCSLSGFNGDRLAFHHLLMQNVVTGCTVMINSALAKLASSVTVQNILMHDWFLALLASACGHTGFLNEATIDYRQHGNNTVGAKNSRSPRYILHRIQSGVRKPLEDTAHQAGILLGAYPKVFSANQQQMLSEFSTLYQRNKIYRIRFYCKYRMWKAGLHRKIAQLIWG